MVSNFWKNSTNFLEKYNFSNQILRGYILAVTHFVTQFTNVSRHPRDENKKKTITNS